MGKLTAIYIAWNRDLYGSLGGLIADNIEMATLTKYSKMEFTFEKTGTFTILST
jgi:hypothetical protein